MSHITTNVRDSGTTYTVRWRDGGAFKQKSFPVKRDEERFAVKVEQTLAGGATTAPFGKQSKTVAEVVAASLAASEAYLKPRTYRSYEQGYARYVLPTLGRKRVAAVTSEDVEAWVNRLRRDGLAPATIRNQYVGLTKAFKYALRHRLISHNPCAGVALPRDHRTDGFAAVFLTAAEVGVLAGELDAQAPGGLLVRFLAFTGLRTAELTGLRVRDVNLAAGHIEVRQTMQRIAGEWRTSTPQSAKSTRNVPLMHRGLTADLRRLLLTHPASGDPDALFWPGRTHGSHAVDWSRPLDTGSFLRNYLRPALDRVDMPRMRLQDLRHTYASLMLAAGFSAFEVSRWMGHASAATTTDIYGHLIPVDRTEQIDRFEAFVGRG